MSYLEEWDVEAHLTRIFGFEGWDKEITYRTIYEEQRVRDNGSLWAGTWPTPLPASWRFATSTASTLRPRWTRQLGDAKNQPSRADANHLALTSAVSTALKRAAKGLGNQFGLSLYNKGSVVPVVTSSLGLPKGDRSALRARPCPHQLPADRAALPGSNRGGQRGADPARTEGTVITRTGTWRRRRHLVSEKQVLKSTRAAKSLDGSCDVNQVCYEIIGHSITHTSKLTVPEYEQVKAELKRRGA